jgi:NADH:ubiquinone oxidoreductase subunit 4 (subunit M)
MWKSKCTAAIVFSLTYFLSARKSEKIYEQNPEAYSNIGKIKTVKIISIIGLVVNLIILGITICTLYAIGWDAWSDEFIRKHNDRLQNRVIII